MIIEDAIYERLLDTDAVTSLVMRNVYKGFRSQATTLPCITLFRVTTMPVNGAGGRSGSEHVIMQIDCWSYSQSDVRLIAEAVKTTLDSWTHSSSPAVSQVLCTDERDLSEPPAEGSGTADWRIEQDWSIWMTT